MLGTRTHHQPPGPLRYADLAVSPTLHRGRAFGWGRAAFLKSVQILYHFREESAKAGGEKRPQPGPRTHAGPAHQENLTEIGGALESFPLGAFYVKAKCDILRSRSRPAGGFLLYVTLRPSHRLEIRPEPRRTPRWNTPPCRRTPTETLLPFDIRRSSNGRGFSTKPGELDHIVTSGFESKNISVSWLLRDNSERLLVLIGGPIDGWALSARPAVPVSGLPAAHGVLRSRAAQAWYHNPSAPCPSSQTDRGPDHSTPNGVSGS